MDPLLASRRAALGMMLCAAVGPGQASSTLVSVRDFGASGDGKADDTMAFERALATRQSVFVPSGDYVISRRLEFKQAGQGMSGVGKTSRIIQQGRDEDATIIRAVDLGRHIVKGLALEPGTVTNSLNFGYGVALFNSPQSRISDCFVSRHRRGAIALFDSSGCVIERNDIRDSVVAPGPGISQRNTGCDIYIGGNSARNRISENRCIGGCGVGIAVQTLAADDRADENEILDNVIERQPLYGIMLYVLKPGGSCAGVQILRNRIADISGSIPEENGRYNYGSGIYLQSADRAVISQNVIENTVSRSRVGPPPDLDNIPAAIGVGGRFQSVRIEKNTIAATGWWAIAVVAMPDAIGGGSVEIRANQGRSLKRGAAYLLNVWSADVSENVFDGPGSGSAIQVRSTVQRPGSAFSIDRNALDGFEAGIEVVGPGATKASVTQNEIRGNSGYAIALHAREIICTFNRATDTRAGARGVVIGAEAERGEINNNKLSTGYDLIEVIRPMGNLAVRSNYRA